MNWETDCPYNKMVQQIQCLMQEQYVLGKAKSEAELMHCRHRLVRIFYIIHWI